MKTVAKNSKYSVFYPIVCGVAVFLLSGCTQSDHEKPNILDDFWDFAPEFMGGSTHEKAGGSPVTPRSFKIAPESGFVLLTWTIPKQYRSAKLSIGYRIFKKVGLKSADGPPWDFGSGASLDWTYALEKTLLAKDCAETTVCSFKDQVGGPLSIDYAVIAYWDISDFNSGRSDPAFSQVITRTEDIKLNFKVGFTERLPRFIIGTIVDDLDRNPAVNVHNFTGGAAGLPWYLLEAGERVNELPEKRFYQASIFPSVSSDGLEFTVPDFGFNRVMMGGRGKLSECDNFPDLTKPLCYQILITKPITSHFAVGQATDTLSEKFSDNDLLASRKMKSRSSSWQFSKNGDRYLFIADEQRILIRKESIFVCRFDPGEEGDETYGAEGFCGFQWSVGVFSPKQRCAFKNGGGVLTGDEVCNDDDFNYSKADSTPPTGFSLRSPGSPKIVGEDLYIPDSGNARVVKIAKFEEAFKKCGRLRKPGDTSANDFCKFTMVLGQGTVEDEPVAVRLTKRRCLRGGERGGYDGTSPVTPEAGFINPADQSTGSAACLMDTINDGTSVRKSRMAGDYKNVANSDISPETALLSERSKRMFRTPLMIETDADGKVYILDAGTTRAKNEFGDREAVLPPRIMVWQKDPFSFEECTPTNPGAEVPSCQIDINLKCSGQGCGVRECSGAECNASWFIGQPAELFGYNVELGKAPWEGSSNTGAFPIASFGVASSGDMQGVWIVTGTDNRLIHIPDLKQKNAEPVVHNSLKTSDGLNSSDFAIFKRGVFSGITVDTAGLVIIGWDSFLHVGVAWTGLLPGEG